MKKQDEVDAAILKIMGRRDAYRTLSQAPPKLEDDDEMDAMLDDLLDAYGYPED
jgi:hypothetical protein